jgi:hypothetical protein
VKPALGFLVRLFPRWFRERYGADMVEHAALDFARDRRRGRLAGARSLLATLSDLCRTAVA